MNPISPEAAGALFPAECHFKIIARDADGVAGRLNRVLADHRLADQVRAGNRSAGGTYVTYNVSLVLETAEQMRALDAAFRAVDGVRLVL